MYKALSAIAGLIWIGAAALAEPPQWTADASRAEAVKNEQLQWLRERDRFNAVDRDGDGFISEQEAKSRSRLLESWNKADLNADGKIDQSEFSAFEPDQPAP